MPTVMSAFLLRLFPPIKKRQRRDLIHHQRPHDGTHFQPSGYDRGRQPRTTAAFPSTSRPPRRLAMPTVYVLLPPVGERQRRDLIHHQWPHEPVRISSLGDIDRDRQHPDHTPL